MTNTVTFSSPLTPSDMERVRANAQAEEQRVNGPAALVALPGGGQVRSLAKIEQDVENLIETSDAGQLANTFRLPPNLSAKSFGPGTYSAGANNAASPSDYVISPANGRGYRCISSYTAGATPTDPSADIAHWVSEDAIGESNLPPNINRRPLRRTFSKLAQIATGTVARLRYLAVGDSLGNCSDYFARQLIAQWGFAGWLGPVGLQTMSSTGWYGGGAVLTSSVVDFSITPTGDYVTISATGHYAGSTSVQNQNGNPYLVGAGNVPINNRPINSELPLCDTAKVGFIGGAGTGRFKVQYTFDGQTFVDVPGLTNVDASTYPAGLNFISSAIPECRCIGVIATWISGSTKIYSTGAESGTRSGVVLQGFHKGSIQVGPDGFAGGAGASALIAACAPDLVTCCALDGTVNMPSATGGIVPAITAIHGLCAALTPAPDEIYYGIPNTQGDPVENTRIYNAAMMRYCEQIDAVFVDMFAVLGPWAQQNANGFAADPTHPSPPGRALVNTTLMKQLGIDQWTYGRSWVAEPSVPRNLAANLGVWPAGTSVTVTSGAQEVWVSPGVFGAFSGAYSGSTTLSRLVLSQQELQTSQRYGMRVVSNTGNWSINFSAGPARNVAGKQSNISFWAKSNSGSFSTAMFYARWGGSGGAVISGGNWGITIPPYWRKFTVAAEMLQLDIAEAAGSRAWYSINGGACDLSFADPDIELGATTSRETVQDWCESLVYDFASIPANSVVASATISVPGVVAGQRVKIERPASLDLGVSVDACTVTDGVVLIGRNHTTAAIDPPSIAYIVTFY